MPGLEALLNPYQKAVRGTPSNLMNDPLFAGLGGGGMGGLEQMLGLQGMQGGGGGGAPAGSGLLELFYGGNQFNPSSVDSTHPSHLHAAMGQGIVPLGRKLQGMGFDVGEHPAFGGVAPVHTTNSHHYSKDAIDVNYNGGGRWGSEGQALNWLERWLSRMY